MPYKELENTILKDHIELTSCKVIDNLNGTLDIVVEPKPYTQLQWNIEKTVNDYFGTDWKGVAIAYGKEEYKRYKKAKSCFSLRKH